MRLVTLLLSALLFTSIGAFYAGTDVIELKKDSFANKVFGSEHIWLVEFYAPWCGHCKALKPAWEKAASNLKGIVKVAAINCDEEKELCGHFGVQGFPTIKFFPHIMSKTKDGVVKQPEDYKGARTAGAIVNFALGRLPNFVEKVKSSTLDDVLSKDGLPTALLFSNKPNTADLFKALSVDFHGRMTLAQAKHTDKELVDTYGITAFPTLVVLKGDDEPQVYDGKLKHPLLYKFLSQFASPAKQQEAEGDSSSPPTPPPAPVYKGLQHVSSHQQFEDLCIENGGTCVVALLDPQGDKDIHAQYIKLLTSIGENYKKLMHFAWIDGAIQTSYSQTLGVASDLPAITVINAEKKVGGIMMGAFEEKSISQYLDKVLRGAKRSIFSISSVPTLVDEPSSEAEAEAEEKNTEKNAEKKDAPQKDEL